MYEGPQRRLRRVRRYTGRDEVFPFVQRMVRRTSMDHCQEAVQGTSLNQVGQAKHLARQQRPTGGYESRGRNVDGGQLYFH